jgi:hypothetical protein
MGFFFCTVHGKNPKLLVKLSPRVADSHQTVLRTVLRNAWNASLAVGGLHCLPCVIVFWIR